jgi:hypothetical protein
VIQQAQGEAGHEQLARNHEQLTARGSQFQVSCVDLY